MTSQQASSAKWIEIKLASLKKVKLKIMNMAKTGHWKSDHTHHRPWPKTKTNMGTGQLL